MEIREHRHLIRFRAIILTIQLLESFGVVILTMPSAPVLSLPVTLRLMSTYQLVWVKTRLFHAHPLCDRTDGHTRR